MEISSSSSPKIKTEDDSIRCLCKTRFDDGFTIQCERCFFWSHARCYNINANSVPELFYCSSCQPTDTEEDVVDEESFINWGDRIIDDYKHGIFIGENPPESFVALDNAAYLLFPRNRLKRTPILSFMKWKAFGKVGNDLYLTLPGQTSWQKRTVSNSPIERYKIVYSFKQVPQILPHSMEEIHTSGLTYFSPNVATLNNLGVDMSKDGQFYRKGCQGNLEIQEINGVFNLVTIDSVRAGEELILQYSDLELEHLASWSFQEFLSGCKLGPKSCIMLTCGSCKFTESKHCRLYHKMLKNQKMEVSQVRGDQPALTISPVEPHVKRKRGRPPKKKPNPDEVVLPKKKKIQSPKLTSRKQSVNNSPIIAPRLNPTSITPSQISDIEIDELIPQIEVYDDPISDLTYIQIGNGMVVKRARLKTVKKCEWRTNKVMPTQFNRKMAILNKFRSGNSPSIVQITDFIK